MADLMRYLIARIGYALAGCDFDHPRGSTIRTCPVCGRREELDINDGASLNAWHAVRKGDPQAHFRHLMRGAPSTFSRPSTAASGLYEEIESAEHETIPATK
jgi:hypothetical protein